MQFTFVPLNLSTPHSMLSINSFGRGIEVDTKEVKFNINDK